MRRVRRARRPLVALVALVLALAVGYGVRACHGDDTTHTSMSGPSEASMHT